MYTLFLNCNYPWEREIPKGKPKEITDYKTNFEIIKGTARLIAMKDGDIYIEECDYYWGIRLERFFLRNATSKWGIDIESVIRSINWELDNWYRDIQYNKRRGDPDPNIRLEDYLLKPQHEVVLWVYLKTLDVNTRAPMLAAHPIKIKKPELPSDFIKKLQGKEQDN